MRKCYLCNSAEYINCHHIFGAANRKLSEKYNLKVDLCAWCHLYSPKAVHKHKPTADVMHRYGQRKFMEENNATIAEFVKIFGKNYLDEEW